MGRGGRRRRGAVTGEQLRVGEVRVMQCNAMQSNLAQSNLMYYIV